MLAPSRRSRTVTLTAFCLAGWAIESCGGGGDGDTTGPPPGSSPVSTVEVQPNPLSLTPGQTAQLTVTLKAADGSILTGRTVTWATSAAAVATVDATGNVTALSAGTATITATSEGKSGSTALTVTAVPVATVATVEVIPNPATVAIGQSAPLAAVLKAQDATELTGRTVTWSTSDPGIVTVTDAGVINGVAVGSATITATSEGKTGTSAVTVSAVAVASVQVTPPTAAVDVGGTTQLTATAKDGNGAVLQGRPFAWTTSNASIATVSPTGRVTGVGAGTATITATSEGKSGTATVTATLQPVAKVEVTPNPGTVLVGGTLQLAAVTKAGNGTVLTGRPVTWKTSNATVATVNASGLVTGVAAGTATITATSQGVDGTDLITVTPPLGITRTWVGGAAGHLTDWFTATNWNPAGVPIAIDSVRVPVTPNAAEVGADAQVAQLTIIGGVARIKGHRLLIKANPPEN